MEKVRRKQKNMRCFCLCVISHKQTGKRFVLICVKSQKFPKKPSSFAIMVAFNSIFKTLGGADCMNCYSNLCVFLSCFRKKETKKEKRFSNEK
jgi:hypothetical protein